MNATTRFNRAAIAACVPFTGTIALTQLDIFRSLDEVRKPVADAGAEPVVFASYVPILAIIYMVSALPVIILAFGASTITKWAALAVSLLLFLFHCSHIVEHVAYGDTWGGAMILVTSVIPYGLVLWLIFRTNTTVQEQ
ncbi:MAG: hypothetical protein AAF292_08960 [Pseudomonadota bacterium]